MTSFPSVPRFKKLFPGDPLVWLELVFLAGFTVVFLIVHHQTETSITAKDHLAVVFSLLFCGLGCWSLIEYPGLRRGFPTAVILCLVGYLFYGIVRVWSSPYPDYAWRSWCEFMVGISPLIPCYLLTASSTPRAARFKNLCGLLLILLTTVIGTYAILQFLSEWLRPIFPWALYFDPLSWAWHHFPGVASLLSFLETDFRSFRWQRFPGFKSFPAACSFLGNPNYLVGFLVPALALLFTGGMLSHNRRQKLFLTTCGVGLIAMAITFSRGGLLGLVAAASFGLMALSFFPTSHHPNRLFRWWITKPKLLRFLSVFLLLITIAVLVMVFIPAVRYTTQEQEAMGSIGNRTIIYRCTAQMIHDYFWLGAGPGHFAIFFPDYLSGTLAEAFGRVESPEDRVLDHAHSELLEIWADLGAVGLSLYLGILISFVITIWKAWPRLNHSENRVWILALLAALVGIQIHNLFSINLRITTSAWMFWGIFGATLGLARPQTAGSPSTTRHIHSRLVLLLLPGLILCGVCLLSVGPARQIMAEWYYVRGRVVMNAPGYDPLPSLQRAHELDPTHSQYLYMLAGIYFSREDFSSAISFYEELHRVRGDVAVSAENLATAWFKLSSSCEKEYERKNAILNAIEIYRDAQYHHPGYPRLADYLARCYHRLGLLSTAHQQRLRAIDQYERWFAWGSSYPRPDYALDVARNYLVEGNYERTYISLCKAERWHAQSEPLEEIANALIEQSPEYRVRWENYLAEAKQKQHDKLFGGK